MILKILHISDLHERASFDGMPDSRRPKLKLDAEQRRQVLGDGFFDALRRLTPHGVDLVCMTGDISDWGRPEEFEIATERLSKILDTVQAPRSCFFAVPGNHDVLRSAQKNAWNGIRNWHARTKDTTGLGRWMRHVDDPPLGLQEEWRSQVLERTAKFWEWLESFTEGNIQRPSVSKTLGYRVTLRTEENLPIAVVGLDSAWLSGDEYDQGRLVVTDEQLTAHLAPGSDGLSIALIHHPLDHLVDHHSIRRSLARGGVDLLLHGHQHDPLSIKTTEGTGSLCILASGCLMEGDLGKNWPNSFHLIQVNTQTMSGHVSFEKWAARGFWTKGTDLYEEAPDGNLPITLTRGPQASSRAAVLGTLVLTFKNDIEVLSRDANATAVYTDALTELEDNSRNLPVELAWPRTKPWAMQMYDEAIGLLRHANPKIQLHSTELFLLLAIPHAAIHILTSVADFINNDPSISPYAKELRSAYRKLCSITDEQIRSAFAQSPAWRAVVKHDLVAYLIRASFQHPRDLEQIPIEEQFSYAGAHSNVRWRLLAGTIHLASILAVGAKDLSNAELQEIAIANISKDTLQSFFDGLVVAVDQDAWIIQSICEEPVLDHVTHQISEAILRQLVSSRDVLDQLIRHYNFRTPKIEAQPRPKRIDGVPAYTTPHVRFQMSPIHTRELFMGASLWRDEAIAYRELFQNALDACRYRQARCRKLGIDYHPVIVMRHIKNSDGTEQVECQDNGIGMTREVLGRCFAVAGSRFTDLETFQEESSSWSDSGVEFSPNSKFGIGVFSYFLVASDLEIETARLKTTGFGYDERLKITIPTANAFFSLVPLSDERAHADAMARNRDRGEASSVLLDAGTRITLTLLSNTSDGVDEARKKSGVALIEAIKKHVWYSDIKLIIQDYRGNYEEIQPGALAPWISARRASKAKVGLWWALLEDEMPDGGNLNSLSCFRTLGHPTYQNKGRILVDGIATNIATPGFIINLTGSNAPKLSMDRRHIYSNVDDVIYATVQEGLPELLAIDRCHEFRSDLYLWDPRICFLLEADLEARSAREGDNHERSYIPFFKYDKGYGSRDEWHLRLRFNDMDSVVEFDVHDSSYHKFMHSMWMAATKHPNATSQNAQILSAHGVDVDLINLATSVPAEVWARLSSHVPNLSHSVLMKFGLWIRGNEASPYHLSWLMNLPFQECVRRVRALCGILDIGFTEPRCASSNWSLTDYGAWLMSLGDRSSSVWVTKVANIDVCYFASKTGTDLQRAYDWYVNLVHELDLDSSLNYNVVKLIGVLSDSEMSCVRSYKEGLHLFSVDDDSDDRQTAIRLECCGPSTTALRTRMKNEQPGDRSVEEISVDAMIAYRDHLLRLEHYSDAEVVKIFIKEAQNSRLILSSRIVVDTSFATDMRIGNVFGIAEQMLEFAGQSPIWDSASRATLESLEDTELMLLSYKPKPWEKRQLIRHDSAIHYAPTLCVYLHTRSNGPGDAIDNEWLDHFMARLGTWHMALGWGEPPVTRIQLSEICRLNPDDALMLCHVPKSGHITVGRMLCISVRSKRSIRACYDALLTADFLDVRLPRLDDTYLGMTLADLMNSP